MVDAIHIEGVRKTFGQKVAVNSLDLSVPEGSLCGFIGPNGAGKTTTIRMVMSIIFPDSGDITVLGRRSAVESKDRIGYLPEERGIYRKMRVAGFIRYMAKLKGVDQAAAKSRTYQWLERVGLIDVAKKRCEELSKGMQQKVQFVATIIHEPELIILDEPFSGLDPVNMILLRDLLLDLHNQGKTIIFSTHVMPQAEALCDRIIMIHGGNKVLDDTLGGIRERFDPRTIEVEPINGMLTPETLANVPGVVGVSEAKTGLTLSLGEDTEPSSLLQHIAALGSVRRIEIKRPTLEEVFVRIVGEDAHGLDSEGHAMPATQTVSDILNDGGVN